eukprot:m.233462 g.233462  ORF g.233462 m.233462 type:complete len:356 (+) comp40089_c0_seq16:1-1068(+)
MTYAAITDENIRGPTGDLVAVVKRLAVWQVGHPDRVKQNPERNMSGGTKADRTVVLMGRTGAGKSSLANALSGRDDLFGESSQSVSMTKYVESQTIDLTWAKDPSGPTYKVKIVDTIGIGDTDLPTEEVLLRLANACHECKDGLNAVYFVTGGRFTKEEADAFETLWKVLFGPDILEYTTIVRSRFHQFRSAEAVQKDQAALKKQKGPSHQILEQMVNPFLYIDVPPADYGLQANRDESGALLLDHLVLKCKKHFCPPVLDDVKKKISKHVEAERETAKQLESLGEELEQMKKDCTASAEEKAELQKKIKEIDEENKRAKASAAAGMTSAIESGGFLQRIGAAVGGWIDKKCSVM